MAGKTASDAYSASLFPPDPNSNQSTINTVVREVREAGGEALPVQVDVRNVENVEDMVGRVTEVGLLSSGARFIGLSWSADENR